MGPCAFTELGGDCEHGSQGSWQTSDMRDCALRCAACRRCRHLSFSAAQGDCSWYVTCPRVLLEGPAYLRTYTTLERNAFDMSQVAAEQRSHAHNCDAHRRDTLSEVSEAAATVATATTAGRRTSARRVALATLLFPSAAFAPAEAHARRGRRGARCGGDGSATAPRSVLCALPGWCASALRLKAALSDEWDVEIALLVHGLRSGDDGNGGGGGGGDGDGDGHGFDAAALVRDCVGGRPRLLVPAADLVEAVGRHAKARAAALSINFAEMALPGLRARFWGWLLKWHFLGAVEYDAVLFADLDVDLMPHHAIRSARLGPQTAPEVARAWHTRAAVLIDGAAAEAAGTPPPQGAPRAVRAVLSADSSSPVNTAVMLLLPSRSLYADGLAVLSTSFSVDEGWNRTGPPHLALGPPTDVDGRPAKHVAAQLRSHRMRRWAFTAADLCQGFFAYMLLGRHRVGRYAGLEHRAPAFLVHHHWRRPKPWMRLPGIARVAARRMCGGDGGGSDAGLPWRAWSNAPLDAICQSLRYVQAIAVARNGEAFIDGPPARSPCLAALREELAALRTSLRNHSVQWPLCVEDCKAAPDNPGGVRGWVVVRAF